MYKSIELEASGPIGRDLNNATGVREYWAQSLTRVNSSEAVMQVSCSKIPFCEYPTPHIGVLFICSDVLVA